MDRIYFISDAHLGVHAEQVENIKTNNLVSFLNFIQNHADYLYIVGDLYDFWFEYRSVIPKINLKVMAKLLQLGETGTEIRYFTGNHDIWHESYFEKELGIRMFHGHLEVNHNGLQLFVAHGDGLAGSDWKLRLLNRIMKNRFNIFLYKLLHPDIGIPLARMVSLKSKEKGENKFDVDYRDFALKKLSQGFDAVILGHTHKPLFERINSKYYVNLGDWVKSFTYLELNGTQLELKKWALK